MIFDNEIALKTDGQTLKKFGVTMGIALLVITAIVLIRQRHSMLPTLILSGAFFILAAFAPVVLRPFYVVWMRLAFLLGWINTRLLLCVIFYVVFTPLAMLARLFRRDALDRRIEKKRESYWGKREDKPFNPADYERLF